MFWKSRRRTAPVAELPPPPPPVFPSQTVPLTSDESAAACKDIVFILDSNPVDLEALREKAFSNGGFQLNSIRERAWPRLLQIHHSDGENFRQFLKPHKDEEQVAKDVERSLWHWHHVRRWKKSRLEAKRKVLSDVMNAVLAKHPGLHYFQGYHDLAGLLCLVLGEPGLAFAALERLSLAFHRESMRPSFRQVTLQLGLLHPLVAHFDPPVHAVFAAVQLEPYYAVSWVLTWLAHDLPDAAVCARLVDALLAASDPLFSLYLAAAIIIYRREEIFQMEEDFGIIHNSLIKLPPGLDWEALLRRARTMLELAPPALLLAAPVVPPDLREDLQEQRLAFLEGPAAPWLRRAAPPDWLLAEEARAKAGRPRRGTRRARRRKAQRERERKVRAVLQNGVHGTSDTKHGGKNKWRAKVFPRGARGARRALLAASVLSLACLVSAAALGARYRRQCPGGGLLLEGGGLLLGGRASSSSSWGGGAGGWAPWRMIFRRGDDEEG